jgi:hypothetical protein
MSMPKAFALTQKLFALLFLASFFAVPFVYATDMTSASFIIRDPLIGTGGSYGSSASFQAFGSGDMTTIGRSTSASFEGRYGFLWFPYVTQGVFTATPNGSQADLSWGASTAGLGWSVSGYKTGIATVSGGPYSYTTHGLITSYSYTGLSPGLYCFVLQTLDAFSNVIATSPEECITIQTVLTFSISSNSIDFGTLSTSGPRYATTTGGSGTNSVAHTMSASSNAGSGYTITYFGPTLTSGSNTITPTTITNDADGTPGSSQFALSLSSSGSASIASAYNQTSGAGNWKFVASTTETIANTSGVTTTETFSNRYLSNISSTTPAGSYSTDITYVITGNF